MNVGSVKYHPGVPSYNWKVETVPCLVEISEGRVISGNILTSVPRHLYNLKLYDSDRENFIYNALLVDGHASHFDLGFLKYICDENHKWNIVFGVPCGT